MLWKILNKTATSSATSKTGEHFGEGVNKHIADKELLHVFCLAVT